MDSENSSHRDNSSNSEKSDATEVHDVVVDGTEPTAAESNTKQHATSKTTDTVPQHFLAGIPKDVLTNNVMCRYTPHFSSVIHLRLMPTDLFKLQTLDHFFEELFEEETDESLQFWNKYGQIVYSDDTRNYTKQFVLENCNDVGVLGIFFYLKILVCGMENKCGT